MDLGTISAPTFDVGTQPMLSVTGIVKHYGPTVAVNAMDLVIRHGEVIGLIGANGAGKSTMIRILAGVTQPDAGTLRIDGTEVGWNDHNATTAVRRGLSVAYQELSLCHNLTVYENFFVAHPTLFADVRRWRQRAKAAARRALAEIFPDNTIDVSWPVEQLSIAQRQMVEIARALAAPGLRLLILDEPTSSLGNEQVRQLQQFMEAKKATGISFVFISHRLSEVSAVADQIVVMANGSLAWHGHAAGMNEADMVTKMGGSRIVAPESGATAVPKHPTSDAPHTRRVTIRNLSTPRLHGIEAVLTSGEIVGIAGLEGSGQQELLRTLYRPNLRQQGAIERHGRLAYVTGDRAKEGIFPLWSITNNLSVSKLAATGLARPVDLRRERSDVEGWLDRLGVVSAGPKTPILSLSGGNQQKILIARALLADADIILLDDPTRGVDIGTKEQLYELLREAASRGKLILWYSTDDEELTQCQRVLVMRNGYIVDDLRQPELSKAAIVEASFTRAPNDQAPALAGAGRRRRLNWLQALVPFIAMMLVLGISGSLFPSVFSKFGLTLLVGGAVPMVFAALSQLFVIGLSHVDLGVGAFMGLVNVVSATLLLRDPVSGVLALLAGLVAYALMGLLIYARRIPAIVVTLGASFVWTGVAFTIQDAPGGQAPAWLTRMFRLDLPVVPWPITISIAAGLLAIVIYRSRYGTVLRGFGNNPAAMVGSGWSAARAYATGYFVAGVFAVLAGLAVTAMTTASDANATASYTLLTVAAVVMGGGALVGGSVSPMGAVFGAITLSLIGSLLGFLNLSSNYVTAVQGLLLLFVLGLRLLGRRGPS